MYSINQHAPSTCKSTTPTTSVIKRVQSKWIWTMFHLFMPCTSCIISALNACLCVCIFFWVSVILMRFSELQAYTSFDRNATSALGFMDYKSCKTFRPKFKILSHEHFDFSLDQSQALFQNELNHEKSTKVQDIRQYTLICIFKKHHPRKTIKQNKKWKFKTPPVDQQHILIASLKSNKGRLRLKVKWKCL